MPSDSYRMGSALADALPAPMRRVVDGHVLLDDRPGLGIAGDLPEMFPGLHPMGSWVVA